MTATRLRDSGMLQRSFIHLQGVGEATERAIWDSGIETWDDFARVEGRVPGLGPARCAMVGAGLNESRAALARGDARFFGSAFK